MKKILLATMASSLIAVTASASAPEFKSGSRLGFGTGFKHHRVKHQLAIDDENADIFEVNENLSKTSSTSTYNAQLHGGYDWILGQFLVGLEGQYRYSPGTITTQLSPQGPLFIGKSGTNELTQKHRHDFGLALHLGRLVTKNIALYAIGSVRLGQFQHHYKNTQPTLTYDPTLNAGIHSATKTQYRWGYGLGLGVRWKVSHQMSLGFETTYDTYQQIKYARDLMETEGSVIPRAKKPHIVNAMVTASWHF